MKALTLHQPWASLVAVGAKKIETRSWSTSYRGPLAIHAGKKRPRSYWSNIWFDQYERAAEVDRAAVDADAAVFEVDGPCWSAEESTNGEDWYHRWRGPLGAVVASATLVDVVPIVVQHEDAADLGTHYITATSRSAFLWHPYDQEPHDETMRDYPGEAPFGDFSLGRFAWLLDDVARVEDRCPWCRGRGVLTEPERDPLHTGRKVKVDCPVCSGAGKCDPVPARGRQGLWEWSAPDEEKNR